MSSRDRIVIGTRKSRLALAQSQWVADAIRHAHPGLRVDLHPIVTQGDIKLDKPLPQIGGKGLFTSELEDSLRAGHVDLAVHSAKDLPTSTSSSLDILCVPIRAAVNDVLVTKSGLTLAGLPVGSRVGTSSLRRQMQLRDVRPDLQFADIRGNIDTRVSKTYADQYDAVILAQAGLVRAAMTDVRYTVLPLDLVLPAPGQAALALQGRSDDLWLREILSPINNLTTSACLTAERTLLERLALDCHMPFAALCEPAPEGFRLRTWLAGPSTAHSIRTDLAAREYQEVLEQTVARIYAAGGRQIIATFKSCAE